MEVFVDGAVFGDPDLFRRFADAMPDGLWLVDGDGRTLYANARLAELLGRTLEETLALRVPDILDEDGERHWSAKLEQMRAGHPGEENVEVLAHRPDGSTAWLLTSWAPFPDAQGRPWGWMHRLTDIGAQHDLVEELRDKEDQLETAQAIAHVGSWTWYPTTDSLIWSDELCRIHGVEPGQSPRTWERGLEFIHPDDRGVLAANTPSLLAADDRITWQGRITRLDGQVRWIKGVGRADRDGDGAVRRVSGTAHDVTELVVSELAACRARHELTLLHAVAERANRSTTLVDAVTASIEVLESETTWRPLALYLCDPGSGRLVLHRAEVVRGIEPDPAIADLALTTRRLETRPTRVGGGRGSVVAIPVLGETGVLCVIELVADVDVPDATTRELIHHVTELLAQVARRERGAAELAQARDAAMDASHQKSEFLATMSHEIRTPMNGVIGLTELLIGTALDEHQLRLAESLRSAGRTLLSIINDILDLSKIESGKLELETTEIDPRDILDRTVGILSGAASERGLSLVAWCDPDVPSVLLGDATRLGQVIDNLGSNAIKFTDEGEVSLRVSTVSVDEHGTTLRVTVTDSGIGIPGELHAGLFDAFAQADRSTTRRHGGTGLGLAICARLVEAMDGRIGVDSVDGQGSMFWFTARFGTGEPDPTGRPSYVDLGGHRVLVVEAQTSVAQALTAQLDGWGARVEVVADAEAAHRACADAAADDEPFTLALVDVTEADPVLLESVHDLRTAPGGPALVLISGPPGVSSAALVTTGAVADVTKPIRLRALADAVRSAAGHPGTDITWRARRQMARPGTRVLVVEDNPVNQMVAQGYLESLGITVEIAADGVEAVDRLLHHRALGPPVDAVLMDCRMPRLDGYAATRTIRAAEDDGERTGRLPIIAMTASALDAERDRCLAAGMDDFLAKPVETDQLARTLARWLPGALPRTLPSTPADTQPGQAVPARPRPAPAVPQVLDAERAEMLKELVKDGVNFFDRTRASFLSRIDATLGALSEAVERDDSPRTMAVAHQLKGSALNLGLGLLGDAAHALEQLARADETDGAGALLAQVRLQAAAAVEALVTYPA